MSQEEAQEETKEEVWQRKQVITHLGVITDDGRHLSHVYYQNIGPL